MTFPRQPASLHVLLATGVSLQQTKQWRLVEWGELGESCAVVGLSSLSTHRHSVVHSGQMYLLCLLGNPKNNLVSASPSSSIAVVISRDNWRPTASVDQAAEAGVASRYDRRSWGHCLSPTNSCDTLRDGLDNLPLRKAHAPVNGVEDRVTCPAESLEELGELLRQPRACDCVINPDKVLGVCGVEF